MWLWHLVVQLAQEEIKHIARSFLRRREEVKDSASALTKLDEGMERWVVSRVHTGDFNLLRAPFHDTLKKEKNQLWM